jgi:hypothetical protein
MVARRVGVRRLAACAAAALLLACGESTPEPAPPAPAPDVPAPAPAPPSAPAAPSPVAPPPEAAPAPQPPPEAAPPAEASLSLEELGQRIKQTPAIGTFSKLSLKNDLDDLVDGLRGYHHHEQVDIDDLHQRYEALVLKLMTLLEDGEPELAVALGRSRERIWNRLLDPVEFAKLST